MSPTAKGTQEEVLAHKRRKVHCSEGKEEDNNRNVFTLQHGISKGREPLEKATGGEAQLLWGTGDGTPLVQATGGQAPLAWAKGSWGLILMQCLVPGIQVVVANYSSHLRQHS